MMLQGTPKAPKDYTSEFREMGVNSVRSELLARRWHAEKLAAARVWVEREDAKTWADSRAGVPARVGPKPIRKYAAYIASAFGIAYAAVRIFRTLRYGM